MSTNFSYQNCALKNLPDEEWRPVLDYEDFYEVSNFGRIRSFAKYIEFLIPGRHVVAYWKPAKILAQGVTKKKNSFSNEEVYQLTVTFCVSQKMKTTPVSRVVWAAFGHKLDYESDGLCVLHKDGDGRNNHFNNLTFGNQSEMAKAAYKRGRLIKLIEYVDEPALKKRSVSLSKPVTQYNLNGLRIKVFGSVKEATLQTGIFTSNISLAAKGKKLQMGGFIWRYGKGRKKIDVSFYVKAKKKRLKLIGKTVTQYDLSGQRIRSYHSIKQAANAVGINPSGISRAMLNINQTAAGYIWK